MPRFRYTAFDHDGGSVSGTIDALDDAQALEMVAARGLTPVDLELGALKPPWWARELSLTGASSVKPRDFELLFSGFATLLNAQIPLPRALAFCEGQAKNRELKQLLSEVQTDVANGQTLGVALETQGTIIPERLQSILRLGEASNTLASAVSRVSEMLKTEAELARELKSALIYPAILLVMSLAVLALVVFYLAPTLAPVFETADAEPPLVLRAMLAVKSALTQNLIPLAVMVGLLAVTAIVFKSRIGRQFGVVATRLPLVGAYINQRETLRLCQNLSLMLSAGSTLPDALRTAEQATTAPAWVEKIADMREGVEAGQTLSHELNDFAPLDATAYSLIQAGEESDNLVAMLSSAGEILAANTRTALQRALRLLTPALTMVIGGMVGFLIISTISAILDLNDIAF